jgi:hypothetical protein
VNDDLDVTLMAAAQLVDAIDSQRRRDHDAFAEGYRLGYQVGHDVGVAHAQREADADWSALAIRIRAVANQATYRELQERRGREHTRE